MTLFEDHLVRDINAGRFAGNTSLVLVTHGLAARIFLMRWFHWTVDQFMSVFNPPNAEPLVMERVASDWEARQDGPATWIHTKVGVGALGSVCLGWVQCCCMRGVPGGAPRWAAVLGRCLQHTHVWPPPVLQALYRLSPESREIIKGCTEDMCRTSWLPRAINPLDPADSPLL